MTSCVIGRHARTHLRTAVTSSTTDGQAVETEYFADAAGRRSALHPAATLMSFDTVLESHIII